MIYSILLGLLGFVLMGGAEWATYKRIRWLKPALWIGSVPILVYAFVRAWLHTSHFDLPDIVSTVAWVPLILFWGLFIYSLYIEIPLKSTYISSPQATKLVSTGTYSLCRHPAALWFAGWIVSAVLASKSITLAVAAPFWFMAYMGHVLLEEKLVCLTDLGDEYKEYQKTTPMLLPTRRSVASFGKGLGLTWRKPALKDNGTSKLT